MKNLVYDFIMISGSPPCSPTDLHVTASDYHQEHYEKPDYNE